MPVNVIGTVPEKPFLLDPLGELAADGAADNVINLDRLLDACDSDEAWPVAAKRARVNPDDITIEGLRELLRQALPRRQVFFAIARRWGFAQIEFEHIGFGTVLGALVRVLVPPSEKSSAPVQVNLMHGVPRPPLDVTP